MGSIDNNGTVQFAGTFDYATNYEVTVQTQPTLPAQIRLVASGSGVIGVADVAVFVTCEASAIGNGAAPAVATILYAVGGIIDPNGMEGFQSILAGYSVNLSGSVTPAVSIYSLDLTYEYLNVATDSSGNIYIAARPFLDVANPVGEI